MAFIFVLLLIVFLYLQWRNKTKKTKRKQNRQKANNTELVQGINISTGTSTIERQGLDPQEALSAAVKYKKEKDFNKAIDSLYEAYKRMDKNEIDGLSKFLRLPMYLQAAGRNDEGWSVLNKFILGDFPVKGYSYCNYQEGREKIIYKISEMGIIYNQMRIFLEKEKKYKQASVYACVSYFTSIAQTWHQIEFEKSEERTIENERNLQNIKDLINDSEKYGFDTMLSMDNYQTQDEIIQSLQNKLNEQTSSDSIFSSLTKSIKKAKSLHLMDQLANLIIDSQKYFPDVSAGIEVVIRNSQQLFGE